MLLPSLRGKCCSVVSDQQDGLVHVEPRAVGQSHKGSLILESSSQQNPDCVPVLGGASSFEVLGTEVTLLPPFRCLARLGYIPKGPSLSRAAAYWPAGHSTPRAGRTPILPRPHAPKVVPENLLVWLL